jgi:hypothetical protein
MEHLIFRRLLLKQTHAHVCNRILGHIRLTETENKSLEDVGVLKVRSLWNDSSNQQVVLGKLSRLL